MNPLTDSLGEIARILSKFKDGVLFKNNILKIDEHFVSFEFLYPQHYNMYKDLDDETKFNYIRADIILCSYGTVNVYDRHYTIVDNVIREEFCGIVGPTGAYDFKNVALVDEHSGICYDDELNILAPTYHINLSNVYHVTNHSKCSPLETITLFCGNYAHGIFAPNPDTDDIFKFINGCKYMLLEREDSLFILSENGILTELALCVNIQMEGNIYNGYEFENIQNNEIIYDSEYAYFTYNTESSSYIKLIMKKITF
jgi:hypothetical protein